MNGPLVLRAGSGSIIRPGLCSRVSRRVEFVAIMSKLKTKRAAAKRFRFTGTGKIKRSHAYHRHNFTDKPKQAKMRHRKSTLLSAADAGMVRKMLPYGG
jgi:large subunit ribosomal protein L35